MAMSSLRQFGELLHKAVDIIPGKYGWWDLGNIDFYLPLKTLNSKVIMLMINITFNIKVMMVTITDHEYNRYNLCQTIHCRYHHQ